MGKIKAIGFDFDDTLIRSEKEKDKIIVKTMCGKYGYDIEKDVKKMYRSLKGKVNRQEKIRIILTKILKRKPTKKEIKETSKVFSKEYLAALKTCPLFQCTNVIKELKKQVDFLFLLSLEDKKDVKKVADHCGIGKYFDEILGGPKPKIQNLKHILKKHHVKPGELIYIGDSKNDIMVSKILKIKSIGIQRKFSYQHLMKKLGADFTFSSLCEIPFKKILKK